LKDQLLAACHAAEHWLQAELDNPGETRPDDILRVLRAAIERAEGKRKPRETRQAVQLRRSGQRPRESSKEAMLIDMLCRPEGATIAQIMVATGWQAHTCRGAFAGALKKAWTDRDLREAGTR
jgi:serine/threonine protein kinase HipA of HipAB toxin-antitoxin module